MLIAVQVIVTLFYFSYFALALVRSKKWLLQASVKMKIALIAATIWMIGNAYFSKNLWFGYTHYLFGNGREACSEFNAYIEGGPTNAILRTILIYESHIGGAKRLVTRIKCDLEDS